MPSLPQKDDDRAAPFARANQSLSIFLDALRFLAAFFVFATHTLRFGFPHLPWIVGHDAVIVFFVLSGYVIALTSKENDKTLRQYAVARMARLYSVIVPALLLTCVADSLGARLDASVYADVPGDHLPGRLLMALSCTSQIWFLNIQPLSNSPYWSLPYEFWFYVLWGVAFYLGGKRRGILMAGAAIIMGPKILLYFPIWYSGATLYRMREKRVGKITAYAGIVIALASLPLLYCLGTHAVDTVTLPNGKLMWRQLIFVPLGFSLYDYLIAFAIGAVIFLFPSTGIDLNSLKTPVRFLARRTFSLYLYHYPLGLLFAAMLPDRAENPWQGTAVMALAFAGSFLLANVTELQKKPLARLLDRLLPLRQ